MRQDFKAYVLLDSRNRWVPGSLQLRKPNQRPARNHNGRWIELVPYACCVPGESGTPQTVVVPTLVAPNSFNLTVTSGGLNDVVNTGTATIGALNTYLNTNYNSVGSFVVDGTNIIFTPTVDGAIITIGQSVDGINVTLPTLTGGAPNYHIQLTSGSLTTGDVDTGTTTPAALQTYLTTNYGTNGTFTLNGTTSIVFKATNTGTTLAITAGA